MNVTVFLTQKSDTFFKSLMWREFVSMDYIDIKEKKCSIVLLSLFK